MPVPSVVDAPYLYRHKSCGQVAFYLRRRIFAVLWTDNFIWLDGRKASPSEPIPFRCGSCGDLINPVMLEAIEDRPPDSITREELRGVVEEIINIAVSVAGDEVAAKIRAAAAGKGLL